MDMKPYVSTKTIYKLNGMDFEDYVPREDWHWKLYEGEKLLHNAFYVKENYYAIMENDSIVFFTTDFKMLETFFNGRLTMRERLLNGHIEHAYKHVTSHPDFNPNDPKDKAIVDLYNSLMDKEDCLYEYEHCTYSKRKVDVNKLKWLGETINNILFCESDIGRC